MRFNITFMPAVYWPHDYHRFAEHAKLAEDLGFESLSISSRVALPAGPDSEVEGAFRGWPALRKVVPQPPHPPSDSPWLDPFVTLAAMSTATQTIGLMTSAVIAPLYRAPALAKSVATLSQLSRGRVLLGVTASHDPAEYASLGVDFASRGQALDDTIRACRMLWGQASSEPPAPFESQTVNFGPLHCEPKPVGEVPILFAGPPTPRTQRRVRDWGQGWLCWAASPEKLKQFVRELRQGTEGVGKDPDSLVIAERMVPRASDDRVVGPFELADLRTSLVGTEAIIGAGTNLIRVQLQNFVDTADEVPDFLRQLADYRAELRL